MAVGVERWWNTSADETVATVIHNIGRYNGSTRLLNTTTIYKPKNETFSDYGFYFQSQFAPEDFAFTSPVSIPTTILDDNLVNPGDYAGTSIVSGSVQTWNYTDLRVTSPTPYDEWFNLGILTMYPYLSTSPKSQMLSFEPTQCGYWTTDIISSESTGLLTTRTTTQGLVVETTIGGQSTLVIGTSSTEVFTYTQETGIPISTLAPSLLPSGWDFFNFFEAPMWLDGFGDLPPPNTPGVVSSYGGVPLNVTYIEPRATPLSDGEHYLDMPNGLLPWLASQSVIKSKFPYIEHCWTISGIGQPTVHVPVNQLTTTSTNIIELGVPLPQTTVLPPKTTSSVMSSTTSVVAPTPLPVQKTTSTAGVGSSETTGKSSSETKGESPSETTGESSAQTSGVSSAQTTGRSSDHTTGESSSKTTNESSTGGSSPGGSSPSESSPSESGGSSQTAQTTASNAPQGTLTTSNDLGGLLGAISSVAQQASSRGGSPAVVQPSEGGTSAAPAGSPARIQASTSAATSSVIGFVIGSQTASPGGPAVSSEGTVYSALPSGSGVQVVANGQTSTVQRSAGATGAVSPVQATANDGSSVYVVGSQTLSSAGSAVTVAGTTYSALSSGSGLVVAASGTTSTILQGSAHSVIIPGASGSAYVVGSQPITAGGSAATVSGTTYSALPSDSGLVVAASGATSTILQSSARGVVTPAASGSAYVADGQTITAGGSGATISGTTYSVLPSGSGVQIIAAGATSTLQQSTQDAGFATLPGGQVISTVALPVNTPASITIDGKAFAYQEQASSAVVIGSATLSVGGPAVTESGETLSLVSQGSTAVLVVNGTSTTALPSSGPAQQLVTLGGQIYTAYAAGSSVVVIDGQTVLPGTAMVIDGETVSLSGTDLVVVSGTVTSTEGLGGAIMSGLGGTQVSAATAGSPALYTGGAASATSRPFGAAACVVLVAGAALVV
ncbi:hypothetical protein LTR85_011920 [Meristemomyces frigidus]|nr:hypothetical protein LTR85_011920 [Meristemomyces frigidus]